MLRSTDKFADNLKGVAMYALESYRHHRDRAEKVADPTMQKVHRAKMDANANILEVIFRNRVEIHETIIEEQINAMP